MLWAMISSAFVIYLYRTLNVADPTTATEPAVSADALSAELATLNGRIDALANLADSQSRRTAP
jgi:hypothetical protein